MDICTFQFATKKNFDKVAWQLLETPYTFSVCYGEVHYGLPICITVWGAKAIQNVIDALQDANISYKVVV
jgi:hypothetical protein